MKEVLLAQHKEVVGSRSVLLSFCRQMGPEDLIRSLNHIGNGGSIRNLLVHVCNTYQGWLAHFAMGRPYTPKAYESYTTFEDCTTYFQEMEELVLEFLDRFEGNYTESITAPVAGRQRTASPLQLFTHVITHEFHHKGQILSLGRAWGYTPIDTDIIR